MKPEQLRIEINRLQLEEKLQLVGDILESIASDSARLALSEEQKQELELRYTTYKNGLLPLQEWNSVHEEIRTKFK